VLALSQAIAKENPDTGIKCITVCPGGMNTTMRRQLFGAEDAARQQTPEFMADMIAQVADEKIKVLSGGHIVIRHCKITGIFPPPAA
jgi:NAD(P)-dependent dehydrogenase (short-subunit alcohol dehydrogenase family)